MNEKEPVKTNWTTGTIGSDMQWIDERKASDGFEPDWEPYVDATTIRIYKRFYHLSTGKEYPEGELISPAVYSVISGEIKKLVNELTEEDWY